MEERDWYDLVEQIPDISEMEEKDVELDHCEVAREIGRSDEVLGAEPEEEDERGETVECEQEVD